MLENDSLVYLAAVVISLTSLSLAFEKGPYS